MLLTKEVEILIRPINKKYYLEKGYAMPTHIKNGRETVPNGTKIMVKVEDLPPKSHATVLVQCDYCGEIFEKRYCDYVKLHSNQMIKKDCCAKCGPTKTKEVIKQKYNASHLWEIDGVREKVQNTLQERYGVRALGQIPGIYDKIKKTNLEKYGTENAMQNKEIFDRARKTTLERYGTEYATQSQVVKDKTKNTIRERYGVESVNQIPHASEKRKKTNIQKYGTENPARNTAVREKMKNTCLEKYGCEYAAVAPEVRDKIKNTLLERYGVTNTFEIPGVREKITKSFYENGSRISSCQQRYINDLFNGELNYNLGYYSLDSYIENDRIDIEFNGSGHDLCVKYGTETEERFKEKEIIRSNYVRKHNIRMITIISPRDKLPSDEKLKQMYLEALNYFNSTGHTWKEYYVEEGMYRDAEHMGKTPYDYGEIKRMRNTA